MQFDDGRGEFSDVIRARAPRGLRDQVKAVAAQKGMSSAELIRLAITSYIANTSEGGAASAGV
ncbi:hypothetical protein KBI52_10975 [Microvirga sp. HBU67558]|uniref:hypothetical protein n=1 Tax=Microvirga sp. HBU67558 TaxID=2824562 RepID=UPI001B3655C0|nr:hypothetical protein [Microvirga sp. HBU67558]MBQ0820728.1 hypothetical protein [Microvirga sp. HBU67558]